MRCFRDFSNDSVSFWNKQLARPAHQKKRPVEAGRQSSQCGRFATTGDTVAGNAASDSVINKTLRKLDGLYVRLGTQPQRPDKRDVVTACGDVVVMHRETDVIDAARLEGLVVVVG